MRSCHAATPGTSPRTQQAMEQLQSFIECRRTNTKPVADLEAFERELHERVLAVERDAMAAELAKFDIDVPVVMIDGVPHRKALRCEESYWGVAGEVRVERSLYSARDGERTRCPMELRAGIIDGRWTPWAAQQATWIVAHLTPQDGETLYRQFGGLTPSKSSLDRLPKKLSERWEAGRLEWEEALRAQEQVPRAAVTVAVSLDGVLVPMKDGKRLEKRRDARINGKRTKGPAGYCEASCGTISFYDKDGERLATIRIARMPEPKKITLKEMLTAELARVQAQRSDLVLVKVADFYHAAEHLRLALSEAYGETNPKGLAQFEKLRHVLLEDLDGADKVIRALRYLRDRHPRRSRIQPELTYFRRNRERMNYAEMKAANLPIGSGVVEAACKTLVTQRLKRSGMRWGTDGGQAILTLRSLLQSDRFHHAWALLVATYRARVTVPENLLAFPSRSGVNA